MFGRFKQPKFDLFNHAMLHAKYFIHKQFVGKKDLNIEAFLSFYKHTLLIERQRCVSSNKLIEFNLRFGRCLLTENLNT